MQRQKTRQIPHDHLVREVYSVPECFQELLKLKLSQEAIESLDLTTLRIEKDTFVRRARSSRCDLIYSVRFKPPNDAGKLMILVEHKSGKDLRGVGTKRRLSASDIFGQNATKDCCAADRTLSRPQP